MTRLVLLLLAASVLCPGAASAAGIVTACATDSQQGAGLNLQQAVAAGGTIGFDCAGRVIRVTRTLHITRVTDIDGEGRASLAADPGVPMFAADPAATLVTLRNIELTGAQSVTFGGIFDGDAVKLELSSVNVHNAGQSTSVVAGFANGFVIRAANLDVDDSHFTSNAGTVLMAPVMSIHGSEFSSNPGQPFMPHQIDDGGRLLVESSSFSHNGVSVWRAGDMTIRGCDFSANHSSPAGFGGAFTFRGKATIEKTNFRNNSAGNGGAIWFASGELNLRRVTFQGNSATGEGGAIGVAQNGSDAALTIRYAHFRQNKAQRGGAISIMGSTERGRSLSGIAVNFARNTAAGNGGAINADNSVVDLTRAQFVENTAGGSGGALMVDAFAEATLANVLAVRNTASSGSVYSGNRLQLINATLADNKGPAIALIPQRDAQATLTNTVISNNSGGNCNIADGRINDRGHNMQFPNADCGSSIVSADPGLDSMYVPVPNSPLRFAGDTAVCLAAPVSGKDIFNATRPQAGDRCTIGAVEKTIEPQAIDTLRHSDVTGPLKDFLEFLNLSRTRDWKPRIIRD